MGLTVEKQNEISERLKRELPVIVVHKVMTVGGTLLNRDDSNSQKTLRFGNAERARLSSACQKKVVREVVRTSLGDSIGYRAKESWNLYAKQYYTENKERFGFSNEDIETASSKVMGKNGIFNNTMYLTKREFEQILTTIAEKRLWEKTKKDTKGKETLDKDAIKKELKGYTNYLTWDIAFFGRMIADNGMGLDTVKGAYYESHALGLNKFNLESDTFVATEDLLSEFIPQGAAHFDATGTDISSNTFYDTIAIDLYTVVMEKIRFYEDDITEELVAELVKEAKQIACNIVDCYVYAVPQSKQNSMLSSPLPDCIFVNVKYRDENSLASNFITTLHNLFAKALVADSEKTVADKAIDKITEFVSTKKKFTQPNNKNIWYTDNGVTVDSDNCVNVTDTYDIVETLEGILNE